MISLIDGRNTICCAIYRRNSVIYTIYRILAGFGKDEVGSSNLPSSSRKASKSRDFEVFCCKNVENGVGQNVGQGVDPHRDPHGERCGKYQRGLGRKLRLSAL